MIIPYYKDVQAASFTYDKTTVTVGVNETFSVTVNVNTGTDQTNSGQAYLIYDPTLLQAQSVTAGAFFPEVSNNITPGKVFIVGYVSGTSSSLYKTGTGALATVVFKGLKNGTGTLTIDCRSGVSDSSQIIKYNDANATNLITCADNNSVAITVGTGTGDSSTGGSTLPQSGIMDHFNQMAVIGMSLAVFGVMIRLAL